jgi:flagellin-like hook-associated protein FlgL
MISIGRNILSQRVQRSLGRNTADLASASEKLSSGQRINKSSDDAAGLAIASQLRADSRVFGQAIRNLNDGISLINVAESAMESLSGITERIQELTTQAMNSTFGSSQRQSMQQEVSALQAEWNRIVESTTFNGVQLLTGSNTQTVLQGGKGDAATTAVRIAAQQATGGLEGYSGTGTTRVNTDNSGTQATGGSSLSVAISGDGSLVAFNSSATNLVAGDSNGASDGFIKNVLTGAISRVTTSSAGLEADSASDIMAMSADGRFVVFNSAASNLVGGDTNGVMDGFLKDTFTGVTTRITTGSAGNQGNGVSYATAVSADGRYVTFYSDASNLVSGDTNLARDSFVKDMLTGVTTRVSTDSQGNQGTGSAQVTTISADGRYVGFLSTSSTLVAGDTNGTTDSFIKDMMTGATQRISLTNSGSEATGGASTIIDLSADGRYALFNSFATNLVSGDTNSDRDAFVRDLALGTTVRVSTSSSGGEANGYSRATAISDDGRFVVFNSLASNLIANDTNNANDAFLKDLRTQTTTILSTDSAGVLGGANSVATAISADGRYAVMFSAATNLISGDSNSLNDVFIRDLSKVGIQQMAGMVVSDRSTAAVTLGLIQRYSNELLEYRSVLGATSSRIQTSLNTLQTSNLNYLAAESRISDADFAVETSQVLRSSILQQTAARLLSQANASPELALRLLRDI